MTEAEWRSTDDWRAMLQFIKDKVSPRKIRLFGVACCRRVAHLFHVKTCGEAVDVAERYADGVATEEQLTQWRGKVGGLTENGYYLLGQAQRWWNRPASASALAVLEALEVEDLLICYGGSRIASCASQAVYDHLHQVAGRKNRSEDKQVTRAAAAKDTEVAAQLALIREVFGNPFAPVGLEQAWRTEPAVGLATGIYDDRVFERMSILADALEEAGCDNPDILAHCREPGVHVRGCWVADLVLGKV